ncbi:putative Poly(Beta-D-mannuronate) lyase [uncultured Woeseiaceae bacterium]|uniref:Putative Poly(Beta-D-mannuronate) lyase n=1 Tax=uncultured Woeseiaceae bacterium TaxID=1983305 RepID=A0A7D9H3R1_9GAMM|nr:putative Poly(Beta-D-mannuronate) lyase [uncultured Woeseiaceae bacterium]
MRKLLSILIFLSWTVSADAADISVCTTSDLQNAIASAKPGDDIVMCGREWRDLDLRFDVNGTASTPITLRSDVPGNTIITGRSQILMIGSYSIVQGLRFEDGQAINSAIYMSCNNCRLTETTIIDFSPAEGTAEFDSYQFYVRVRGKNNRVDHNFFSGKHGLGMVLHVEVKSDGPERARIDHNYFGHRIRHPSGNGAEAVKIGEHTTEFFQSGSVVENNYFYRSNGEFEIISVKASGITLRRNTFDRCEGALSLRHGDGSWVDANTFLGHRDASKKVSGIRVNGDNHVITNNYISGINVGGSGARGGINLASGYLTYTEGGRRAAKNILIAFNTIVDSDRSISVDGSNPVLPSNIVIANNIISSTYGPLIAEDKPINGVTYSKNIAHGSSLGVASNGFIVADPGLILSNGFHRISNTSPALDAADSSYTPQSRMGSSAPFIDSEGQTRTGSYDIGADEYIGGVGSGHTVSCDTGPRTYNPTLTSNCLVTQQASPMPPTLLTASP